MNFRHWVTCITNIFEQFEKHSCDPKDDVNLVNWHIQHWQIEIGDMELTIWQHGDPDLETQQSGKVDVYLAFWQSGNCKIININQVN